MPERVSAEQIIERIRSGDWEPFANYGYLMLGNGEHGQFLFPHRKTESDEPVDFTALYREVCRLAAQIDSEDPAHLAERHKKYANEFLLPEQPEGSATDAQALTDLYTYYGLSMPEGCPISVSAINF